MTGNRSFGRAAYAGGVMTIKGIRRPINLLSRARLIGSSPSEITRSGDFAGTGVCATEFVAKNVNAISRSAAANIGWEILLIGLTEHPAQPAAVLVFVDNLSKFAGIEPGSRAFVANIDLDLFKIGLDQFSVAARTSARLFSRCASASGIRCSSR